MGTNKAADKLPLECWIGYRFGLIATRLGTRSSAFYAHRHKLSPSGWRAMAVLARYEPMSAAELSEHTRLDAPKISRAIEALVKRGLLDRSRDPGDQRRAVLKLTAPGRTMYRDIESRVIPLERAVQSCIDPPERERLWSILDKLEAYTRHLDEPERDSQQT